VPVPKIIILQIILELSNRNHNIIKRSNLMSNFKQWKIQAVDFGRMTVKLWESPGKAGGLP
jgi:hypothetical protein